MKRLKAVISMITLVGILIPTKIYAAADGVNNNFVNYDIQIATASIDYEEKYLEKEYNDDLIYQETFPIPIVMNKQTDIAVPLVAATADVSIGIHYTASRGVWLNVLIDVPVHTRESMIDTVAGVFKRRTYGGFWQEYPFFEDVSDRWTVNIEQDLGQMSSGTQIMAQVIGSAKLRAGYIPQFTRTALATIP